MTANGALAATVLVGSVIGFILAKRVQMTAMPELVAILHSFVGLAAVLVGFSSFIAPFEEPTSNKQDEPSTQTFVANSNEPGI